MVDDTRFERAYSTYGPTVLRYCAYSLGSRDLAEDVAAEVFTRYLQHGARLDDARLESWLIRVARNLCASQHRAVARDRRLLAKIPKPPPDPDAWSDPSWWDSTSSLKEDERLVVYLRAVEDRSFAEIAHITNRGQSAVKMAFYRAAEKLRRHYPREATVPSPALGGVEHD